MKDQSSAGYTSSWASPHPKGFHFLTVKGAGHMVPEIQPERALALLHRAIYDRPWDDPALGPPEVDLGPSNATARVGGAASFSVGVGGSAVPPFIYEWYHEAPNSAPVPLPWCTTARCEVTTDARASDAGKYFVIVRGTEGMVLTREVGVTVT